MSHDAPTSLPALTRRLRAGEEALLAYLGQLEGRFAEAEEQVRAFVPESDRFVRLHGEARMLLAKYPTIDERPALFGVPVGVKDIFHVAGFATGGGSRVPPEELYGAEAESVRALKQAGALILGKAVSTEFAYFAPGPTRNPHDPQRTPGGSSSGSAAAVGAGLCPLTLGTQTIGSITRPASFCGVVGYKPSYDRSSRAGVIPLAPSFDHIGPFTVDVAGAQRVAEVLCRDWRPRRPGRRPVLGVPEGPYLERAAADGLEHFHDVCRRLREAGYELKTADALTDIDDIEARHDVAVAAEAARVHERWFRRYGELYHDKTRELLRRGQRVSEDELADALAGRERLRAELARRMDEEGIDLWISPGARGIAPAGLDSTGDPVMSLPWTHAGLPTLALPAGRDAATGLPLGLQVAARWWADEVLLVWGRGLEEALA